MKFLLTLSATILFSQLSYSKQIFIGSQDYPPWFFKDGNEIKGGNVEIMKLICEKLKYKCEFAVDPLARVMKQLEDGEFDMVMNMAENPERLAFTNFTPTISHFNASFVADKKTPDIKDPKELKEWTVGILRSGVTVKPAKELSKQFQFETVEEVDNETLAKKLFGGRYGEKGAVFTSEETLMYFIKKQGHEAKRLYSAQVFELKNGFPKKKNDQELQKAVTAAWDELRKDGTIKKIYSKWGLQE